MKRVNKTRKNLQIVWNNLDKAYQHMEWALDDLNSMQGLPNELVDDMERFDISKISCLKGDIEELMEELKNK